MNTISMLARVSTVALIKTSFSVPAAFLRGVSRLASELAYYLPDLAVEAENLADSFELSEQDHLQLTRELGPVEGIKAAQRMALHRALADVLDQPTIQ